MKAVCIALVALAIPLVLCYDEKFDKVDVDKIIGDDNLFTGYINCMLDKGPCDLEHSEEFKKILPEVIATSCAKCTPIQRNHVRKTVKAIGEKRPDEFKIFKSKYDPNGQHEAAFTSFLIGTD
ncbi:ejaculatory bulb-specific protein 3-like [Plodia interpunctella]|uniref:ejaculatory bulb-specific protein 3-like n=1 Tax=Plodia interpunctella TaxID=58824 RepID=UPI0023681F90|nr:ejaculatory bulb-specific protein 3-like [Plodia interpunctella]